MAARDAGGQVRAAHLDVVGHFGGQSRAGKLALAVAPIGPVHVLQIGDARTLRARRVGRTKRRSVLVANAVGSDLEQLLAPLGVGCERIDVRIPWL